MFYAVLPSVFACQTAESTSVNVKKSVMENSKLFHYYSETLYNLFTFLNEFIVFIKLQKTCSEMESLSLSRTLNVNCSMKARRKEAVEKHNTAKNSLALFPNNVLC